MLKSRKVTLQFVDGTSETVKVGKAIDLSKVQPGRFSHGAAERIHRDCGGKMTCDSDMFMWRIRSITI